MRRFFRALLVLIIPAKFRLPLRYRYHKLTGRVDQEMLCVEKILRERRRFVDVGSNLGIYAYHFLSKMRHVDAFEPIEVMSKELKALNSRNLTVHDVALSNEQSFRTLYMPIDGQSVIHGLASLEPRGQEVVELVVEVRKLDDYKFVDVDLMKIDVEGHEIQVIRGALETLKRCMPIIIIEIEQRHIDQSIDEVFREIEAIGYLGYFLQNGKMCSIEKFSYDLNQKPYLDDVTNPNYMNNFIFRPK